MRLVPSYRHFGCQRKWIANVPGRNASGAMRYRNHRWFAILLFEMLIIRENDWFQCIRFKPDRAMATRSTPPSGARAFRALAPNSFSRKSGPWLLIRACRKLAVSSTGGRLAFVINHLARGIEKEFFKALVSICHLPGRMVVTALVWVCHLAEEK